MRPRRRIHISYSGTTTSTTSSRGRTTSTNSTTSANSTTATKSTVSYNDPEAGLPYRCYVRIWSDKLYILTSQVDKVFRQISPLPTVWWMTCIRDSISQHGAIWRISAATKQILDDVLESARDRFLDSGLRQAIDGTKTEPRGMPHKRPNDGGEVVFRPRTEKSNNGQMMEVIISFPPNKDRQLSNLLKYLCGRHLLQRSCPSTVFSLHPLAPRGNVGRVVLYIDAPHRWSALKFWYYCRRTLSNFPLERFKWHGDKLYLECCGCSNASPTHFLEIEKKTKAVVSSLKGTPRLSSGGPYFMSKWDFYNPDMGNMQDKSSRLKLVYE